MFKHSKMIRQNILDAFEMRLVDSQGVVAFFSSKSGNKFFTLKFLAVFKLFRYRVNVYPVSGISNFVTAQFSPFSKHASIV